MTTDQIHDAIQNVGMIEGHIGSVLVIIDQMNSKIAELEARLEEVKHDAWRANNIASCLANGIQPD